MSKELTSDALEKLEILVESSCLHFAEDVAKPIENELKAFEIIKEKLVNVQHLICNCNTVAYYNETTRGTKRKLTQEEFNLLKEVLS